MRWEYNSIINDDSALLYKSWSVFGTLCLRGEMNQRQEVCFLKCLHQKYLKHFLKVVVKSDDLSDFETCNKGYHFLKSQQLLLLPKM